MKVGITGHRPHKFSDHERIKGIVRNAVRELCPTTDLFNFGGAQGVDLWAMQVALEQNKSFVLHLPFPAKIFAARWSPEDKDILKAGLRAAKQVLHYRDAYHIGGFQRRNEGIVDSSDLLVAFVESTERSGTGNTIKYALKNNVRILNGITDTDILEF